MRALVYCRVSLDRAQGRSVVEQEAENRQVVERNGWELVGVLTDNSVGASRYSKGTRTAWSQVATTIERGGCDVVVSWEASRSTRDLEAYVQLRNLCRKHNVLWCYNGKTFDFSRSDDSFLTGLDILLAEKEVDQARERVLRSMRSNAAAGRPHGKLLYGYKREYDPASGQLLRQVIREDQAQLIREAAARTLKGESANAIATDWNQRNLSPPQNGSWDGTRIKRMLTNPAYIAKRIYQGQIIGTATWPPILAETDYYQLLAWFTDPARQKFYDPITKHLLSGIARCGVCGGAMKVNKPNGYTSYVCEDHFCVSRKTEPVDNLVVKLILSRLQRPDALGLFTRRNPTTKADLQRVNELRGRLDSFYDAASRGEITAAALARIESKLLSELEGLERSLRRVELPTIVYDLERNPEAVWSDLGLTQRREIIRLLLDVRIHKTGRGRKVLDPATIEVNWLTEPTAEPTGVEQ